MSIVTYDTAGGIPRTTINVNPDDKDVRIAALEAERDQAVADARALADALAEAGLTIADWGNYADDYSKQKYGLEDDLKAIGKVLSEHTEYLEAEQ